MASSQEQRRERIRQYCASHKLEIRPHGNAWWIVGNGVSVITIDIAGLQEKDLEPYPYIR